MVLLVSDTLERWTNGHLRAAVHRVGLPFDGGTVQASCPSRGTSVPERRTAVMFFRAPPTMTLGPLQHFVSAGNPGQYEHVTAQEYLKRHNRRLY
jgi:isopenicillin N synthase-like dioxygenase